MASLPQFLSVYLRPAARRPGGGRGGAALLLAASVALLQPSPARAAAAREPLSDWLVGLGDAAAALDRGDPAGSLAAARRAGAALSRGAPASRAALAEGLALLTAGRAAEAVEPLTEARRAAPAPLAPHLDLALARALVAAGRPIDAVPLLAAAARAGPGGAQREARWLEADALLAVGLLKEAAPRLEALLREAPDDPHAPGARLALAAAERMLGRERRAAERYREVARAEPDRPEGAEALAAMARWRSSAAGAPTLSGADRLARADRLLSRGRPAAALDELRAAAAAAPPAPPDQVSLLEAQALLSAGRHAEAEAAARPLEARSADAGVRRGAAWVLAKTASRAGRPEESVGWYQKVAASGAAIPGLPERRWRDLGDEAAYLAAWLWFDAGAWPRAAAALEGFARARPASPRADDARWFAAWARFRQGDRKGAARAFARLSGGALAEGAWYWQGRLAASPAEARRAYRRAVELGGDGWYAALAGARLRALEGTVEKAAPAAAAPPAPLSPLELRPGPAADQLHAAAALLGLGWRSAALAELDDLSRRGAARPVAAPLAELAAFAGDAERPFRAARDLLGATPRTLRWLYPTPLGEVVPARAAEAGVDPDLVRAVIRRESAFQPSIRSGAGAEGLMQLVPATAGRLATLAGAPRQGGGPLEDGAQNVALGTHYLALLVDRFGDEAPALAAYNAGPRPAAAWSRDRAGLPLDEWVEAIPYRETRAYLKAVLSAREVYRRLGGLPPDLDPARPVGAPGDGVAF